MLQNFVFEAEKIPWESMLYMTGHINYGGRVTDDNDRILLMSLLENCYGFQILNPNLHESVNNPNSKIKFKPGMIKGTQAYDFNFFGNRTYKIPKKHSKFSEIKNYINHLPLIDSPEIFGMHQNAQISYWHEKT